MNLLSGMLAAALSLAGIGASHAVVRIANDQGGLIQSYLDTYDELDSSGQMVMIDGLCASACTIVLAAIPRDRLCVTSNANLAFHAAWEFGVHGRAITNREATRMLFAMYPAQVRRWIARRGGLTPRTIFLRGKPLQAMYRSC
ncbi:hypothetical protein [Bradyrhizobium sp. LMTR 3]|uniref:hypothetical protein n=1 Tax=Bradyrhizobium sp. LMTR 3 TaxID=189873 RepID=UPI0008109F37|nr:hypothetical protein [Bradyrhizobium sp. LMTR 3]OCK54470.1 hypothetical protein LMTR3_26730 [Bradyrhizobium sp. LMTR 3]